MRTGNGRHRRPRQAPALFVTAGVTGAGIAIPLLGASGAHAADASTWDRVAQCESGGTWSADQGGGVYGGLALTGTQWRHHGGLAYAPRPDMASRAEQITVAEALLADQGPGAWTTCARDSGLKQGGHRADVDPGAASSAPAASSTSGSSLGDALGISGGSDGTSGSKAPSGTDEGASGAAGEDGASAAGSAAGDAADEADSPSATTPPTTGADGSAGRTASTGSTDSSGSEAADPSATPTGGSGHGSGHADAGTSGSDATAGRHRGRPAPDEDNGKVTGVQRGDGSGAASRATGGEGRTGLDGAGGTGGDSRAGRYTVRPGDNLSVIAEGHGVDGGWPALYAANKGTVGTDPDLIHPGQSLSLHP